MKRVSEIVAVMDPPALSPAIEACLMEGDLSKLDPPGRLQYYKTMCESLHLNPLTKPFEYIRLNGKLTLYATRNCAEQLRGIHNVSITQFKAEMIGDLFVCTASGQNGQGRTDSSTGAVPIAGLSGENLANAMMKAETKAKRRLTLSLCGLGLLDETEVQGQSFATPPEIAVAPLPRPANTNLKTLTPEVMAASEKLRTELKASLDLEGANEPPVFRQVGERVTCTVTDVVKKVSKKGTDFLVVKWSGGQVEGRDAAFCYHNSLFDALLSSKDKTLQFEWSINRDWLTIDNVLAVGEQEYRDGQPFNPDTEPITMSDIPF